MTLRPALWRPAAAGLMLAIASSLGGCGFHPLYGSTNEAAIAKLPDIFVQPISDRPGQELRLALQQRLAGSSEAEPQGYTLNVSYSTSGEAVGINGDNSAERNRMVGRAHWVLSSVSPTTAQLASGDARTVDGYNMINEQYFESSVAQDTTVQRMANNLADIMTNQIATWFINHQTPVNSTARPVLAPTLAPSNVPGDSDQSPLTAPGEDGLPASALGRGAPDP